MPCFIRHPSWYILRLRDSLNIFLILTLMLFLFTLSNFKHNYPHSIKARYTLSVSKQELNIQGVVDGDAGLYVCLVCFTI